ncbi:MAG: L,D-transpeptidase [Gemmatimonadaceae bacterium]
MMTYRKNLTVLLGLTAALSARTSSAQVGLPRTVSDANRDAVFVTPPDVTAPVTLQANLGARILTVLQGDQKIKTYAVAVGNPRYPTPQGTYRIRKIVWNPSWRPPPGAAWAKGKSAQGPGDPKNPMKVVKIFFREPDYYIHGTNDVGSLGSAESHGCLRMDPSEAADLAKMIMDHGGQPRGENWFWRILHFRRQEEVVYLDNPITLTVTD